MKSFSRCSLPSACSASAPVRVRACGGPGCVWLECPLLELFAPRRSNSIGLSLFLTGHYDPSYCMTSRPGEAWRASAMSLLSSSAVKRRARPGLGWFPPSQHRSGAVGNAPSGDYNAEHSQLFSTHSPTHLRITIRACRIQVASPHRLLANFRTHHSSLLILRYSSAQHVWRLFPPAYSQHPPC
jgi:hypothetical protein